MYTREMINLTDRNYTEINRIPKWASDENLQNIVPAKELFRLKTKEKSNSTFRTICKKIRSILHKTRKNVIVCYSEEEMDRKADSLIENGFTVERNTGVRSTTGLCFTTYQVLYWN